MTAPTSPDTSWGTAVPAYPRIGDAGWSVWPWLRLRSAGFPAGIALGLTGADSDERIAELVAVERDLGAARARAVGAIRAAWGGAEGDQRRDLARS